VEFQGFSDKTLPFLESIRQNNSKEWFENHKTEYETLILNPSRLFVEEMGEHLMALEPTVNFSPKINQSLFRIYRDTRRMGANKVPLKHRIGVIFWQGSGKRLQSSSFYLHFSPDELFISVGVRWFEKPMLDAYRESIKNETTRAKLASILEDIQSKNKDYKVIDKGYKRYPKGFSSDMEFAELSLYKGMATYTVVDPHLIEDGEKFIEKLYEVYEDMLSLQQFMYDVSLKVVKH